MCYIFFKSKISLKPLFENEKTICFFLSHKLKNVYDGRKADHCYLEFEVCCQSCFKLLNSVNSHVVRVYNPPPSPTTTTTHLRRKVVKDL